MTLAEKIAAASRRVGGVLEPDKKNTQQHYDYVSADKILVVCGQALAEQGVVIYPSVIADEVEAVEYKPNSLRYDVAVTFHMHVTDGETTMEIPWVGRGNDYAVPDKALYKAVTSGHKYFLMKLLNIGAGNEDGEHEPAEQAIMQRRVNGSALRSAQSAPIEELSFEGMAGTVIGALRARAQASERQATKGMHQFAAGVLDGLTQEGAHATIFRVIHDRHVTNEDGWRCGFDVARYILDYARENPSAEEKEQGHEVNPTYKQSVADAMREAWRQIQEANGQLNLLDKVA